LALAGTPATISGAARLHISGEEFLYLLNKSGVIIGKEWGGTGALTVEGGLTVDGDLQAGGKAQFGGKQQIIFGNADTTNNLKLQLWSGYGLGINPGTLFYAADGTHSWRDASGTNERMALTTTAGGGLTVKGTGASTFAGTVGIGTTTTNSDLQIGNFQGQN